MRPGCSQSWGLQGLCVSHGVALLWEREALDSTVNAGNFRWTRQAWWGHCLGVGVKGMWLNIGVSYSESQCSRETCLSVNWLAHSLPAWDVHKVWTATGHTRRVQRSSDICKVKAGDKQCRAKDPTSSECQICRCGMSGDGRPGVIGNRTQGPVHRHPSYLPGTAL